MITTHLSLKRYCFNSRMFFGSHVWLEGMQTNWLIDMTIRRLITEGNKKCFYRLSMHVSIYFYWIDSVEITKENRCMQQHYPEYVVRMLLVENDICWINGTIILMIANLNCLILFFEKLAKNDTHVLLQVSLRLKRLEKGRN